MNMLLGDGLLDPASFTQDSQQLTQLVENNPPLVGTVTAGAHHIFANINGENVQQYVAVPALKGPDGFVSAAYYPSFPIINSFLITSKSQHPEAAFRWGEHLLSEEMSIRARFGIEGVDWAVPNENELGMDGNQGLIKPILQWGSVQNSHWSIGHPCFLSKEIITGQVFDHTRWHMIPILYRANVEYYEPVAPKEVLPPLWMTQEEIDVIGEMRANINSYVKQNIARFVTGHRNIETEWENYLRELENMGLAEYLQAIQSIYNKQYK